MVKRTLEKGGILRPQDIRGAARVKYPTKQASDVQRPVSWLINADCEGHASRLLDHGELFYRQLSAHAGTWLLSNLPASLNESRSTRQFRVKVPGAVLPDFPVADSKDHMFPRFLALTQVSYQRPERPVESRLPPKGTTKPSCRQF